MSDEQHQLSRRTLLGTAAAGAGGLALIGCGGGDDSDSTDTEAQGTPPPTKKGGTFRLGLSDSSTSDSVDVRYADANYANIARSNALYDTLMRWSLSGQEQELQLAEFFEPADDLSYWDVRLKDAEFHNGKPVTADDVIVSIQRVLDPKAGAALAGLMTSIDPKRLKKLDEKTVRIYLTRPDVNVPDPFGWPGSSIVPTDYDPKNPIGTGPFKFESFTPGRQSVFVRNDNYFVSGRPFLDELVMIGFADPGTTRINALSSGQIDGADHLPLNLVPTLQGNPDVNVIVSPSLGYHTWEMRMDVAPFDDVRVRQAIKLLADRQQIVDQAFSGFGEIANDLPGKQDPVFASDIPQRNQDIEQAKSLLKQAGQSDLRTELVVSPGISPGVVETAQVLAEQAKAAGVTIEVNSIADAGTFFTKYWYQTPFKFSYFGTETLYEHIGYSLLPTSTYNISNWRDPTFIQLFNEANGTADEAKRKEIMGEAQQILWDSGTQAIYAYYRTPDAHTRQFTGFQPDLWGVGLNQLKFDDVGLA